MLNAREYSKALLLDVAWFEAHHLGGFQCMQMVAQCIANRMRSGFGDWSQVLSGIYQPGLYYLPTNVLIDRMLVKRFPDTADPTFKHMLVLIDQIYDNTAKDLVNGAFYWGDLGVGLDPKFVRTIISRTKEHPRTAQSGTFCTWL